MKSAGEMRPSSGLCQRSRASMPSTRPSFVATCGWKCSASSARPIARRRRVSRASQRSAWSFISPLKKRKPLRPSSFWCASAASAAFSRSPGASPSRGKTLMPTLPVTTTSCPPTGSGWAMASIRRRAEKMMSSVSSQLQSSSTNSSPDRRATVSSGPAISLARRATSRSRASPAAWPRLSLMRERRSTFTSSSASWRPLRRAAAIDCCRRSWNSERFGSWVRASWLVRKSSWLWAAFRADRSLDTET